MSFLREALHPPSCLSCGPQRRDENHDKPGSCPSSPLLILRVLLCSFVKEKNPFASKHKHRPKSYDTNRHPQLGWEEPSDRPPLPSGWDRYPAQTPWHRSTSCLALSGVPWGGCEDMMGPVATGGREEAGASMPRAPSPRTHPAASRLVLDVLRGADLGADVLQVGGRSVGGWRAAQPGGRGAGPG